MTGMDAGLIAFLACCGLGLGASLVLPRAAAPARGRLAGGAGIGCPALRWRGGPVRGAISRRHAVDGARAGKRGGPRRCARWLVPPHHRCSLSPHLDLCGQRSRRPARTVQFARLRSALLHAPGVHCVDPDLGRRLLVPHGLGGHVRPLLPAGRVPARGGVIASCRVRHARLERSRRAGGSRRLAHARGLRRITGVCATQGGRARV